MELLAHTRIVVWEGGSLWVVDATPEVGRATRSTDSHAHHAIQIVVGLGGAFRITAGDEAFANRAVAVPPDVAHRFEAEGLIGLVFVEPESRLGRAVTARWIPEGRAAAVPGDAFAAFAAEVAAARDEAALACAGEALIERLGGDLRAARMPDLRVRKVAAWARAALDRPISLADALPVAGLSAGRLRHLFVEETGLPFKTYLLWLRLTRAVDCITAGESLTAAAHQAGFADSAHLSRTFRRMFGIAPTNLQIS